MSALSQCATRSTRKGHFPGRADFLIGDEWIARDLHLGSDGRLGRNAVSLALIPVNRLQM
jgi:hypothetical protein